MASVTLAGTWSFAPMRLDSAASIISSVSIPEDRRSRAESGSGTAYTYQETPGTDKEYTYSTSTTHTIQGVGSFTKTGYTFVGWNKETGKTTAGYTAGQTPKISEIASYCGKAAGTDNHQGTVALNLYAACGEGMHLRSDV